MRSIYITIFITENGQFKCSHQVHQHKKICKFNRIVQQKHIHMIV